MRRGERTCRAVDLDLDGGEGGQREEERGPCLGEQPLDEPAGGLVPQQQRDSGREAFGGRAVRGERQPQHGEVTRPRGELGGQLGNPPDEIAGGAARPAHRAGERGDTRLVADRDSGGETHTEPADRRLVRGVVAAGPPLAGGTQRGQRRDARRVQRRTCVRGHERPGAQGQPQPACHSRARRRVGRILRQLHDNAVPVAAERVVLLRVGVLTEPRRRRRPAVEHPAAQLFGAERVRQAGLHSVDPLPFTVPAYPARPPAPCWTHRLRGSSEPSQERRRKQASEWADGALLCCGACWSVDDRLQPADRIQVIACPDHAYRGCGRFAVIAAQVVAHGLDKAAVGKLCRGRAVRVARGR